VIVEPDPFVAPDGMTLIAQTDVDELEQRVEQQSLYIDDAELEIDLLQKRLTKAEQEAQEAKKRADQFSEWQAERAARLAPLKEKYDGGK